MQRLWIVAYDISNDRHRSRVERCLLAVGERVQWSVFEAFLTPEGQRRLQAELDPWIDPDTDSLRWYPLCLWCQQEIEWLGKGRRTTDDWLLVV